jgi:hypothetical protein
MEIEAQPPVNVPDAARPVIPTPSPQIQESINFAENPFSDVPELYLSDDNNIELDNQITESPPIDTSPVEFNIDTFSDEIVDLIESFGLERREDIYNSRVSVNVTRSIQNESGSTNIEPVFGFEIKIVGSSLVLTTNMDIGELADMASLRDGDSFTFFGSDDIDSLERWLAENSNEAEEIMRSVSQNPDLRIELAVEETYPIQNRLRLPYDTLDDEIMDIVQELKTIPIDDFPDTVEREEFARILRGDTDVDRLRVSNVFAIMPGSTIGATARIISVGIYGQEADLYVSRFNTALLSDIEGNMLNLRFNSSSISHIRLGVYARDIAYTGI